MQYIYSNLFFLGYSRIDSAPVPFCEGIRVSRDGMLYGCGVIYGGGISAGKMEAHVWHSSTQSAYFMRLFLFHLVV